MYFKQIELHGFKSFADRTQLNLEPGVTGIVGPNGCGKSNILDALRWALGEQSAKALRGAHMQDVIFNGSEHRPATGMAEVSLTFDNAGSNLPVDFAEVQITRRVYRSGESEYLLNKAPCRLKDIQELFMDTGVGTNAYSLIGQGKIDLVLSSKPEDRRFLFEEAAGIIKYKTRKRVAMRKLESAEQNLLRLSDIVAEVQRQMRSLKRQVNAAIRHREITASLRELEIRNAWLRYNELTEQIKDLKDRYAIARETFEKSSTAALENEALEETLNIKRIEIERMLMARRDGEYQIDSEMEKIESKFALLRKEIEFCEQQQEQALHERDEFTQRADDIQHGQSNLGEQATGLSGEAREVQDALAARQQAYNEMAQAVAENDERLDTMRQQALETINTRNRTQTELETLGVSLSNIDSQLEGIYARQQELNARHEEASGLLKTAQELHAEKQKALSGAVEQRRAAQEERTKQSDQLQQLNQEWQNLRETRSSQEARLASLRELRDSYEGFAVGVRAVMMAKQQGMSEMRGIIGPVGDLLSTDKEFGQAIEAALGGNINNVVCEEADAAKSAIAFLKKHQAGRVTFLPLDTIRASHADDSDTLRGLPGVIGPAIDHVHCERRILPAVQYLLFNTVIVETIDDAIRIARSERRFPRLVTLDGEVVSSAGAVTGGRTKHESRGLLGRTAEIEELEGLVHRSKIRIDKIAEQGQQLTAAIDALSKDIRAAEESENTLRGEMNQAGVVITRHTTELDSLTRGVQEFAQQRDALIAQREEFESRRGVAQEKAVSMVSDDESLQRQIAEAQEAASKARQALSACGDELTELRVRLAGLTQSIEDVERNKVRVQREHAEALREAERRMELIGQFKNQAKALQDQIADSVERAKALSETREEAHMKVLEAQKEQDKLLKDVDKLGKTLKELRNRVTSSQKEVHHLELDLSQKEGQVATFQERIASEYGLALGSLDEKEVGADEYDENEREKLIDDYRKQIQRLGPVNLMAIEEYDELEKRNDFLVGQEQDLRKAKETLLSVVSRIDGTIRDMFLETFRTVEENFKNNFRRLFNGGQARIYLLDEDDPLECGIEIEARPPGKKPQTISLLSGGEQAMTAIALLFGIFAAKPSPFCVLDEVDAPLDDANVERFLDMLVEFTEHSQFIIITHSKQTMARASALFGVTQQERGVSQLVSVHFEDVRDRTDLG
jgi:chromosome segregation protein